jgi:hypothetical protein
MASAAFPAVKIQMSAHRPIIFVPSRRARALRDYLQTKGITTSQPEEVTSDTSSLELRPKTDVKAVQALLDQWGKPPVEEV